MTDSLRITVVDATGQVGAKVQRASLVTGDDGILAGTRFGDWPAGR
jgi:hypothetical protein